MMDQLLLAVIFIVQLQGGKPIGTATGFFYQADGKVYLVTNRHVVIDETKGLRPDTLLVKLHTDGADLTKFVERTVRLYDGPTPRYRVHRSYPSPAIDVAVISLPPEVLDKAVIKAISKENFAPDDVAIAVGQRAIITGCPYGLHDTKNNLAIARSGMIASMYSVDFQGLPAFLVDANLHPGTSGSPVMSEPSTLTTRKNGNTTVSNVPAFYFLGVHSAIINLGKPGEKPESLGLAQVWRARLIEEIIADGK
jgi:S1-C subfamily serine protease